MDCTWSGQFTRKSKVQKSSESDVAFERPKQRERKRIETKRRDEKHTTYASSITIERLNFKYGTTRRACLTLCSAMQTERLPRQVVDRSQVNSRYSHAQRTNKKETKKKKRQIAFAVLSSTIKHGMILRQLQTRARKSKRKRKRKKE